MKSLLIFLSAISAIIFFTTVYQIVKQPSGDQNFLTTSQLHGFQSDNDTVPGLKELKQAYFDKISAYNSKAESNRKWGLWIGFLVTALTAASALVTSIHSTKSGDSVPKGPVILVAIFTFLATLGNWGTGQFTVSSSDAVKKEATVSTNRGNFYLEYEKAKDDPSKEAVITKYNDELQSL